MNKKKILSLILVCCMLVGMIPAALAEGEAKAATAITAEGGALTAGTYELTGDITLTTPLTIAEGEVVINLNGHTLTGPTQDVRYVIEITGGNVTITGGEGAQGTITAQKGGINCKECTLDLRNVKIEAKTEFPAIGNFDGSTVTLNSDVELIAGGNCGVSVFGDGVKGEEGCKSPTLIVDGAKITLTSEYGAIQGNGGDKSEPTITVKNGAEITAKDTGLYLPQAGKVTVTDSSITAALGIGVKSGELTIENSTITGTGDYKDAGTNNNGINPDGSAILVEVNSGYAGGMKLDISGNSVLTSTNGHAIREIQDKAGNGLISLNISGGTFSSASDKDAILMVDADKEKASVTGGIFSTDPTEYLADGCLALKEGNNYTVGKWDDICSAKLDVTNTTGVSASGFTLSGNVDMRTYVITDTTLQTDFSTLLEEKVARDTIKAMYIKGDKSFAFANIKFSENENGLEAGQYYYIRQVNPGLDYAYSATDFPDHTKTKKYTAEELKDGLNFIVSSQEGDITFEIARCGENDNTFPTVGIKTFTITNNVTFSKSDAPDEGGTKVEVGATTETTDDEVKATAKVESTTVSEGNINSAANGTLTIAVTNTGSNVTAMEIELDNSIVSSLAEADNVKTSIETPIGTVVLSPDAVQQISSQASSTDVVLTVKKTDEVADAVAAFVVEVNKGTAGGDKVNITGLHTPITLSFKVDVSAGVTPKLYYVEGSGKYVLLADQKYENGVLSATTTHLSTFAAIPDLPSATTANGIGAKVTLTSTKNRYLTVQVTSGNSNSIFTTKVVDENGEVDFYVPVGSTVNAWETTGVPAFTGTSAQPNGVSGSITIENITVKTTP